MCKGIVIHLHLDWQIGTFFFVSKIIIHLNKGNYYGCNYG